MPAAGLLAAPLPAPSSHAFFETQSLTPEEPRPGSSNTVSLAPPFRNACATIVYTNIIIGLQTPFSGLS